MIVLNVILQEAIQPALELLPEKMNSDVAKVMLLAIGLQESRFKYRFQIVKGNPYVKGPARGYWQFERGGGALGVLNHPATKFLAQDVCKARDVAPNSMAVWNAMETDDILAAAFARLLLFTDPLRLPSVNDAAGGWDLYSRTWRPGRPHRETWDEFHAQARAQVLA